ncbi:MAG: DnaA regulatory inactivator Hda [Betaproteobacteria bacterium]|nr:DnaA regulatory inactivator Hda [Betaproteobacteria bacterium]
MKQLVLDLIPTPLPTLANFVIGQNGEAVAALKSILDKQANAGPSAVVYLWGQPGSGKTHLMQACAHLGCSTAASMSEAGSTSSRCFAIDDVQTLSANEQQTLFNLINRQQAAGGAVFAAGSVAPRDLPMRRDLTSRLASGLVFQLTPLTDGEKAAALAAHARGRGFALREEVIAYLLRHARRDMASLIGTLDVLDKYSIETGREITVPLLREVSQPSLV